VNLFLFDSDDRINADTVVASDDRVAHLHKVLNSRKGDRLRVGELGGLIGEAEITALHSDRAVLRIEHLAEPPPPKLPFPIVLALPRPKMLRRILRTIAEMGAPQLYLIHSYRVEKSYWQTPVLESHTLRRYLLDGLAQSRDTILPSVTQHRRFKPFVEDILPTLSSAQRGVVLHPGPHPHLAQAEEPPSLVVIGPEGGFIPYEINKLEAAGCQLTSMGARILRVENAVTTVLGRFQ